MSLKMVIPKGRMNDNIMKMLEDCGIYIKGSSRSYRPVANVDWMDIKLLKSANIPPMVAIGQHDCGFAGYDWVVEQNADVELVCDLGFDPVRIVAAIPEDWDWEEMKQRRLIAVSEYRTICSNYLAEENVDSQFIRSYGATEVFPPEDADIIVDNTATGSTLKANRLKIIKTIMHSSTHFIANKAAMTDPARRDRIENLALLFRSVLAGRERVLLEMNCPEDRLDTLVNVLPAMKAPTVAKLYKQAGFSVKSAVKKNDIKDLIPKLIEIGATDILEMPIRKVIP